jgi:hypothetical protein
MGHDLVPIEVKVNPLVRATAFRAAQKLPIKPARLGKVVDRKRQMKRVFYC